MNEIFKKIEDAAHYAHEHGSKDSKLVSIIIATPDVQEDNVRLLSYVKGTGFNVIDTLIHAFESEPKLMKFAKSAIAVIEGEKVIKTLNMVKAKEALERCLNDSPCCDKEQPTCTEEAFDPSKGMGACDADNRNREYDVNEDSGEERGSNEEE